VDVTGFCQYENEWNHIKVRLLNGDYYPKPNSKKVIKLPETEAKIWSVKN
jgi:hypothetical protein